MKYQTSLTLFLHGNTLGSTQTITDQAGAVVQDALYYPWGQRWAHVGTLWDERFASLGQRDSEATLDPTLFRMYSSGQGRWLSPDALAGDITNPQSLNRYAYVLNNPTDLIDPLGLDPCPENPGPDAPYCVEVIGNPPTNIPTMDTSCSYTNGFWCGYISPSGQDW